jgi:hypothetical protein
MNKKGMLDDWFDLVVTVLLSFFALFFLYGVMSVSLDGRNDASLDHVIDVEEVHTKLVSLWSNRFGNTDTPYTLCAITHWSIFAIIFAIGLFFILSNLGRPTYEPLGEWQHDFLLNYVYQAEKDVFALTTIGIFHAHTAAEDVKKIMYADHGCGVYNGISLWNTPSRFCDISLQELFFDRFVRTFVDGTGLPYAVDRDRENLVATLDDPLIIISTDITDDFVDEIWNENVWHDVTGGLEEGTARAPPIVEYEYDASLVFAYPLQKLEETRSMAFQLVQQCKGSTALRNCLDTHKDESWSYGGCTALVFPTSHIIPFCVDGKAFALDFTSGLVRQSDVHVQKDGTRYTITIPLQDGDSYTIYYTNVASLQAYRGNAADIVVFESAGQFVHKRDIVNELFVEKCTNLDVEVPVICNNNLLYTIESEEELYVTATTTTDDQETLIQGFIPSS